MIYSMTGYGSAVVETDDVRISVEVKSLNSKQLDLNIRLPRVYNEKENEIRNLVSKSLVRGKVSLNLDIQYASLAEGKAKINREIFLNYYKELKELAELVGDTKADIFRKALDLPQVIDTNSADEIKEDEWKLIQKCIEKALKECNEFRVQEGQAMENTLRSHISIIADSLKKIIEIDPLRVENIRNRVRERMETILGNENYDKNRFEQEMIYYLEKLDITEEKVRLANHLEFFNKTIKDEQEPGKKMGFISQEIGREINTIGSKANDSDVQKLVVVMKDELEKIKEQSLNVL